MYKSVFAFLMLSATALGWQQRRTRPVLPLGESTMIIEWVVGGEAALKIAGESEHQLDQLVIGQLGGRSLFDLKRRNALGKGLSGFMIEVSEPSLERLLANLEEGPYRIRAHTARGRPVAGEAFLSFDLPPAPILVAPLRAAINVPFKGLTVHWKGSTDVKGYFIELEQDDNDGLTVHLPPNARSFRVPDGVLERGKASHLEVAAIGENGNYTIVEVPFTTSF